MAESLNPLNHLMFKLHQTVKIDVSGETGLVVARAEYDTGEDRYLIRYKNAHGTAVEQWWDRGALSAY